MASQDAKQEGTGSRLSPAAERFQAVKAASKKVLTRKEREAALADKAVTVAPAATLRKNAESASGQD